MPIPFSGCLFVLGLIRWQSLLHNGSLKNRQANWAASHRRTVNRRCPPAFSGCLLC
ncbi:hypothetical protein [Kingella oralis]|uniref:hypothetical protein n=1 Tax=Kingella oralis TaxID=505 RepID=UPI0012DFDE8F|nr:hypothetical protein [Kingella oralis]QMT43646.1 hypothetical protein H3L93_04785 [Kingella oralis]